MLTLSFLGIRNSLSSIREILPYSLAIVFTSRHYSSHSPASLYSRFIVQHVDDGFGGVRDEVPHNVLVAVPSAMMQRRLSRGIDRQQRVPLTV